MKSIPLSERPTCSSFNNKTKNIFISEFRVAGKYLFCSKIKSLLILILALIPVIFLAGFNMEWKNEKDNKKIEIKGIYGSPDAFWKKGHRLDQLGVNSIFLSGGSLNEKMMKRAGEEKLKIFAEFPVLNGKNYVDKHPEAWAVDNEGNRVQPASWFMGVCPTEPGFRKYRMGELRKLLQKMAVDGVWMDYLHWHAQFEEPDPILPETCFCDNCLTAFESSTGISLPEGNTQTKAAYILNSHDKIWRSWRCSVIAGWARDFKMIIDQERPGALLGVFHCPWTDSEFNGARRRILGLDYDMLKEIVDVFSPMVYHGRMGRDPAWVGENIEWFCKKLGIKYGTYPKVWPIVQAYDDPKIISPGEFGKVLKMGLSSASTGVMMFTAASVAGDASKTATMQKVYSEVKE
jgi:hypothetical protein